MDFKKMLGGIFGSTPEEKVKHSKWAFGGAKSETSRRMKAGHKGTSGKRYDY